MRHILSILMENESGCDEPCGRFVLRTRLQHRLPGRSPNRRQTLSRMTIVTHGDEHVIEQITKQLNKLD